MADGSGGVCDVCILRTLEARSAHGFPLTELSDKNTL
jgi:hypothetical protein